MMPENDVAVDAILSNRLLIIAPHMDDEVLGCGGTVLRHRDKHEVFCVYVSDGARSPTPLLPWQGRVPGDLAQVREREAKRAMQRLGIPEDNATFLRLTDGGLTRQTHVLRNQLKQVIQRVNPRFICVPFCYDLHPDHVAVHRAVRKLQNNAPIDATVLEYFIYFRWPLISQRDIRCRAPLAQLVVVDTSSVAAEKRAAIECYETQTRTQYAWQTTPVLTRDSIESRCSQPEYLLISRPDRSLIAGFSGSKIWLRIAHHIQMRGKRPKDQLIALVKWFAAQVAFRG